MVPRYATGRDQRIEDELSVSRLVDAGEREHARFLCW